MKLESFGISFDNSKTINGYIHMNERDLDKLYSLGDVDLSGKSEKELIEIEVLYKNARLNAIDIEGVEFQKEKIKLFNQMHTKAERLLKLKHLE